MCPVMLGNTSYIAASEGLVLLITVNGPVITGAGGASNITWNGAEVLEQFPLEMVTCTQPSVHAPKHTTMLDPKS